MIDLNKIDTKAPETISKKAAKIETKLFIQTIDALQKVMYAQGKYSLLIILQGLDASGKDGTINKVFKGINPLGCKVAAFKKPTSEEAGHDFLWRIHPHAPAKGMITIFNRSHYEDVLVPYVEDLVSKKTIQKRYDHINNFEQLITDNNTIILKFYLHISKEEQRNRLEERKVNPKKFWKHNDEDWDTSEKWDHYMEAYHEVFKHCNEIPWIVVPTDNNWYKKHIIAKHISEAMQKLDLEYPGL